MAYRVYQTLIASLGAVALVLSVNETFAETGAGNRGVVAAAPSMARPMTHPFGARSIRQHRRSNFGVFWPPFADTIYAPTNGQPALEYAPPPASADIHYTYTYDVPWDWAHRYPPNVTPSDRPYVPGCSNQAVTVPGRDSEEHTVNVTRCY